MSGSRGHFAQSPEPLLLHDGLLCTAQVVVGELEGAQQLRLVCSKGDVLAQLTQKLAVAAGEVIGTTARNDQQTEQGARARRARRPLQL